MKMKRRKHLSNSQGFTLLETSVAMVVMLIAVLGSVSVFVYSIRNNSGASDRELAMAVAQQKLEQLRSVSFTDSSLNATTGTSTSIVRAGRTYTVVTKVTHSNTVNGQPTVKTIEVQATPEGTSLGTVFLSTVRTTVLVGPNR
jgi:prepilin-type N-terminal cleavage/methylation domain-containing protein